MRQDVQTGTPERGPEQQYEPARYGWYERDLGCYGMSSNGRRRQRQRTTTSHPPNRVANTGIIFLATFCNTMYGVARHVHQLDHTERTRPMSGSAGQSRVALTIECPDSSGRSLCPSPIRDSQELGLLCSVGPACVMNVDIFPGPADWVEAGAEPFPRVLTQQATSRADLQRGVFVSGSPDRFLVEDHQTVNVWRRSSAAFSPAVVAPQRSKQATLGTSSGFGDEAARPYVGVGIASPPRTYVAVSVACTGKGKVSGAEWMARDGKDNSGIQGPGRLLSEFKKELVQQGGHLPVVKSFIVEPTLSAFLTSPRLSLAGGRACCGLSFSSALAKGAQAAGGFHFLAMASGTLGQCPPPPNPGTNPRRQGSKGALSRQPLRRAGQLEPLARCGS
ncbi:hypothetical protein CMUS01_10041 [Colletotrichum musicola]|uniref:Uncharacterized protein n=1 Tax=Colletotrichum musicola TaxID=2175873 RepID=A0A8H6K5L3_9PEZI|nr:hypothetical protein CMUS01_10041 [Colletotrichum musicola]